MKSNATYHKPIELWAGTGVRAHARLTPFVADGAGATGTACIVCPGGSYFWLDRSNEGRTTALWLQRHGVTAFLLEYRTAGVAAFMTRFRLGGHVTRARRAMQDIFMAIDYVRRHAAQWSVDPGRIGVLGFSAGGHIALMAAEKDGDTVLRDVGIESVAPPVPAFAGAIYPVVSFVAPCAHGRSRRGLIGDFHGHHPELRRELSAELHARAGMPPVFIVSCDDDRVVHPDNSRLMAAALARCGARHEYHSYRTGGHGFGIGTRIPGADSAAWPAAFLQFLKTI